MAVVALPSVYWTGANSSMFTPASASFLAVLAAVPGLSSSHTVTTGTSWYSRPAPVRALRTPDSSRARKAEPPREPRPRQMAATLMSRWAMADACRANSPGRLAVSMMKACMEAFLLQHPGTSPAWSPGRLLRTGPLGSEESDTVAGGPSWTTPQHPSGAPIFLLSASGVQPRWAPRSGYLRDDNLGEELVDGVGVVGERPALG